MTAGPSSGTDDPQPPIDPPERDEDVAALVERLGLPGLIDLHVHFLPGRVERKVWAWFDRLRRRDGTPAWPVTYRGPWHERVEALRRMRVVAFTTLPYAHRPGMSAWLNGWSAGFARLVPEAVQSATFYPEPHADRVLGDALQAGARIAKVHLQVGAFDPRDARLRPVWRRLEREAVPVVVHCGSAPVAGDHTGPGPFGEVLADHPGLRAVVAHMGSPDHAEFAEMCLAHPHARLDTSMTLVDASERHAPYPAELLARLGQRPDKVVFGSDFPAIPHRYAHQVAGLVRAAGRAGLGADWLRQVLCHAPARLLADRSGRGPADGEGVATLPRVSADPASGAS